MPTSYFLLHNYKADVCLPLKSEVVSTVLWPHHFHKSIQIHLKGILLSALMEDRVELKH